jgi:hypothetical protein
MTKIQISLEQNAIVPKTCRFSIMENASSDSKHENDATIKVIIASGNVFHPNARISIIPPQLQSDIIIRIGENNLFEEESLLVLDLSQQQDEGSSAGGELQVMGSYNQFAPRCKVQCQSIGNANIFNPLCDLMLSSIKSGNVYQSSVKIHDLLVVHQEKVCFRMTEDDDSHDSVRIRNHTRGVQVNVSEVSLLLVVARKIVQKNHRILDSVI